MSTFSWRKNTEPKLGKFELLLEGAARTQAPTATNYDVGCSTWEHLRQAPLLSAMEVTNLGHGPSWSPIDPIQVSMLLILIPFHFITTLPHSFFQSPRCGTYTNTILHNPCYFMLWYGWNWSWPQWKIKRNHLQRFKSMNPITNTFNLVGL